MEGNRLKSKIGQPLQVNLFERQHLLVLQTSWGLFIQTVFAESACFASHWTLSWLAWEFDCPIEVTSKHKAWLIFYVFLFRWGIKNDLYGLSWNTFSHGFVDCCGSIFIFVFGEKSETVRVTSNEGRIGLFVFMHKLIVNLWGWNIRLALLSLKNRQLFRRDLVILKRFDGWVFDGNFASIPIWYCQITLLFLGFTSLLAVDGMGDCWWINRMTLLFFGPFYTFIFYRLFIVALVRCDWMGEVIIF